MPRLVTLLTICVLILASAAMLLRGADAPNLGYAVDPSLALSNAGPEVDLALQAPRARTPRANERTATGTGRATLRISVRCGAEVSDAPIQAIGASWGSTHTDGDGVARLELPAGAVEVLVPARDGRDFVTRYAPAGLSNAILDLRAGEEREVDLLVYRGSGLEVDLCDVAGTPLAAQHVNLHRRESRGWSESEPYATDERGRVDVLGLPAGEYLLEQGAASALWFPPQRVALVAGERRRVALVAEPRREVSFGVRALRAGTGEVLPLHFEARLYPRARADEPVPADHARHRLGWPGPDGRVSAALHARRYEVELRPRGMVGDRTQLVEPTVSRATIDVTGDGIVHPDAVEVVVADIGPLAVVRGRLDTELEEGELDVWAQVIRRNGRVDPLWVFPAGEELRFVLVVDLDLMQSRRVEFFDRSGPQTLSLGTFDLAPGEQALTLRRPRDR